jgi:hypothetical protein
VGCVGLVRDVTRVPSRWEPGDTIYLLRGAGAGLVTFVWEHAPDWSLAHDVSDGGLELAVAEAAAWSGLEPRLTAALPDAEGVVVAARERPRWDDTVELGAV